MNEMMRLLLISIVCILSSCAGLVKNSGKAGFPEGYFTETPGSYVQVASATDRSIMSAKLWAMQNAEFHYMVALGNKAGKSSGDTMILDSAVVKRRILKEHVTQSKRGDYTVYLLIQTAKNPDSEFEEVDVESLMRDYFDENGKQ